MNWALAIGPHPGESLPSLRGRHSGHEAQLTHAEGPDEFRSRQGCEVFLCLFRKVQQREHLSHSGFAKTLLLTDVHFG
jgi:hypothetical protein